MDDEPPAQLFAVPARSISPGQRWKPFSWRAETSLNSSKRPQKIYRNISKQISRRQLSVDQMWLQAVRPPTALASLYKCSGADRLSIPLLLDNWTRVSSGMLRSFPRCSPHWVLDRCQKLPEVYLNIFPLLRGCRAFLCYLSLFWKWDVGSITFPLEGQAGEEILISSNWLCVLLVLDCKETQGCVFLQIYWPLVQFQNYLHVWGT